MVKLVTRVIQPATDRPAVEEDLTPSIQFRAWTKIITDRALIIGTGNPEGVVQAEQGAQFMDETGISGGVLYIKRDAEVSGDKTLGWIRV